jgi:hypothetical protein
MREVVWKNEWRRASSPRKRPTWRSSTKSRIERASVEKPPVGIVENAWATASNKLIAASTPVQPRTARTSVSSAVRAT